MDYDIINVDNIHDFCDSLVGMKENDLINLLKRKNINYGNVQLSKNIKVLNRSYIAYKVNKQKIVILALFIKSHREFFVNESYVNLGSAKIKYLLYDSDSIEEYLYPIREKFKLTN